ncbi:MAG TPA: M48 family peptidase, partial [Bacteroidales bacterium]|nr:M48 family peptidase [Bacteroidales bacterium]
MAQTLFIIILIIVVFNYLFELWLDFLDSTRWSNILPEELTGIYDVEKYRKSQEYEKVNMRYSLITGAFSFLLLILMLTLGGFAWLDGVVRTLTNHPVLMALLFFAVLGLVSDLLTTPFSAYH